MAGRAHTQNGQELNQPRTSTWRSSSRKPGGVALNPLPANPGGALAYSDWAVPPHAPPPNLKTLSWVKQGASTGQRRRKENSKAEKFKESTEKPVKSDEPYKYWTNKNPNESNELVYSLSLLLSTSTGQWQLKRNLKAEDIKEPFKNRFKSNESNESYKSNANKNPNEGQILNGQRRRKKNSKAEKFKESTHRFYKTGEDFVKSKWIDSQHLDDLNPTNEI